MPNLPDIQDNLQDELQDHITCMLEYQIELERQVCWQFRISNRVRKTGLL